VWLDWVTAAVESLEDGLGTSVGWTWACLNWAYKAAFGFWEFGLISNPRSVAVVMLMRIHCASVEPR